jgi:PAS domain S-box-containing protein
MVDAHFSEGQPGAAGRTSARLERALRRSTGPAILLLAPDGRIDFANDGACRLWGFRPEELVRGLSWAAFFPPATGESASALGLLEDARREGAWKGNAPQIDSQSRPFDIDLVIHRTADDASVVDGFLIVASQRTSDDEEGRFRDLLESAPDAMVIVDRAGRIQLVNSQTESLFGYKREDLLGQPVEILIPSRFHANHPSYRIDYFAQPRVRPMGMGLDLFGRRRDGTEFPVEISLSPLKTANGTLVSSSIRDITQRKSSERALQEKNVELNRAILAKDFFLASMSHELRTPLNAILGFTGTLLMRLPGPLSDEQERQLRTVQSSARHLLSLINDILDLAKIESGKVEIHLEPVHSQSLVEEVEQSLRPQVIAKGLEYVTLAPKEPIYILADRRAVSQILLNLVNNAIKFTESGRVTVELAVTGEAPHRTVRFAVIDTGPGIRSEDRERLFDAFSRLDTIGRRIEGTGLGLHLSRKLAELLEARLDFASDPGRGTTFTLEFTESACPPASS